MTFYDSVGVARRRRPRATGIVKDGLGACSEDIACCNCRMKLLGNAANGIVSSARLVMLSAITSCASLPYTVRE